MDKQKFLTFAVVSVLVLSIIIPWLNQRAHADGLTQEMFSASLGDRKAELLVKVNPPILTDATKDEAYMLLRLYNANNNETIKFTTFGIRVEHGVGENAKRIFSEVFHTESGVLRLKVQPAEGPVEFFGTREQFQNALVADPGGTINIRGPMFLEGGIYHIRIDILGVDSIRELFPPYEIIRFDSWLSVGDVFTQSIEYQGESYNTTIISYYDRVGKFDFDAETQKFSWAMPFDWNATRIENTNIFVHEEVQVPKSLEGFGDSFSFVATVNDKPISGRMLAVDPYSSEQDLTLHYLVNKNDILNMAKEMPVDVREMTFTLAPATNANVHTTTELFTENGAIKVGAEWTPLPLSADTESTLTLSFFDELAGKMITGDVTYDMRIFDGNGTQVYAKTDQVANGGIAKQTIAFPQNEHYRMEVQINGIVEDGESDQTRNGVARGTVVVPEFNVAIILALIGAIGAVIIAQRFAVEVPGFK